MSNGLSFDTLTPGDMATSAENAGIIKAGFGAYGVFAPATLTGAPIAIRLTTPLRCGRLRPLHRRLFVPDGLGQ